ncbi:GAF domain-containing protein [Prosthecobacter sp.]|uniref:GAF domain-containing protein n=1 Tax=Prosthecobacter sp. TaxID=1965333 RepID=UPI0037846F27
MPAASSSNDLPSLDTLSKIMAKTKAGCPRSELLKEAIRDLATHIRSQNTALFEVEPEDPEFMVLVATINSSDTAKKRLVLPTKAAPGKGITSWCASEKGPGALNKKDLDAKAEYHSQRPPDHLGKHDLYSILWVPLRDEKDRLVGLLKCENKLGPDGAPSAKGSFTPEDLQLALQFQQVLMLALLWPYPVSPEQSEARKIVRQIALKQLKDNTDPQHLFQIILSAAVRILKADRGDLAWWMGKECDLVYAAVENGAPSCPEIKPGAVLHPNSFMRAVFSRNDDYDRDNEVHLRKENYLIADERVRSELAVRIDLHGNPVGVINVEAFQEEFFNDGHIDALRDIAQAAAIAVQQAQFNRLLQRAMVFRQNKPEKILQPVLEGILESLGYDAGLIYRYESDSESHWLRVAAYVAAPDITANPAEFKHMLDKPSFARQVFELKGKGSLTCLHPHQQKGAVDQTALEKWKINTPLFGFPLKFGGKRVGCIVLWTIHRQSPRHIVADQIIRIFQLLVAARISQWNKNADLLEKKTFFDILSLSGSFMVFTKRVEAWGADEKLPDERCQPQSKIVFEWANDEFKKHVWGKSGQNKSGYMGRLEGCTDWDIFPNEALSYYMDDLETLRSGRINSKLEHHVRPCDGAVMQVRVWKAKFKGADKKVRILVFFWDRTDTHRIEMANELWSDDFYHRVSSCLIQVAQSLPGQSGKGPPSEAAGALNKSQLKLSYTQELVKLLYEKKAGSDIEMSAYCTNVVKTVAKIYESSISGPMVALDQEYCRTSFSWPKARACVRILVELVSNAYLYAWHTNHTSHEKKIVCSLKDEDGGHLLIVSDNGQPFDPAFSTAHDEKGLGIVKRLASDSLGSRGITYERTFHGTDLPGNTYRILLPTGQHVLAPPLSPPEPGHGPCILFVDDDPDEANYYIEALRREKYHVLGPVTTMNEAKTIWDAQMAQISLVVLDITLGDAWKEGIELAHYIRSELKPGSDVPIIFFTKHGAGHALTDEAKLIPGTSILVKHANRVVDDLTLAVCCRLRDRALGDKLFICYSGKNRQYMHLLRNHLQAQGIGQELEIKEWSDEDISAGDHWYVEICKALNSSVAAVLLVDSTFMNCKFIRRKELPLLLNTLKIKGKSIFPIFVSATATKLEGGGDLRTLQFMGGTEKTALAELEGAQLESKLYEIACQIREDLSWYLGKPPDYAGAQ